MRLVDWRGNVAPVLLALVVIVFAPGSSQAQQAHKPIEYNILEDLPADTLIGNIATDARLSQKYNISVLRTLRYSLLSQPNQELRYFDVEERSGIITTVGKIDRDEICPEKDACTLSMDLAVSPAQYFQVLTIRVEILDKNDNAPVFDDAIVPRRISEAALPESEISLPVAFDPDSPVYGVQRYKITPATDKFDLRQQQGLDGSVDLQLVLRNRLDRERNHFYQLTLMAYDGGIPPKSGSVIINVTVDDANDNHPEFYNSSYEVSIPEDIRADSTILTVQAYDVDIGINADILYGFTRRTANNFGKLFGINPKTGDIFLQKALDYEKVKIYHLVVSAQDQGPSAKPTHATVIVNVKDVNDNPPQIRVNTLTSTGEAKISESSPIGTFVAHVSVVDPDFGENGLVMCELNDEYFQLRKMDEYQYKVVTNAVFDREVHDIYKTQIRCQDKGLVLLEMTQNLTINVVDVNDNAPVFTQAVYSGSVQENNELDVIVLTVKATDLDMGKNAHIRYSLHRQAPREFTIGKETGIVRAAGKLDRERMPFAEFIVVARDGGTPSNSSTATVSVTINDVNDEAPKFSQTVYSFGVFENQAERSEVGVVHAFDGDAAPFNTVEYSLVTDDQDVLKKFQMNPATGKIETKVTLDREENPVYYLKALAFNPGFPHLSATVSLTIYVADENDHDPIVDFPNIINTTVSVSNKVPVGYVVTRIRARDDDIGRNGQLAYFIRQGNDDDLFDMDETTGAITVNQVLLAVESRVYNLSVVIRDLGIPLRNASTTIHIEISSAIPFLTKASSRISGSEITATNSIIVIIVGCISAAVIIALIIAIIAIRLQDGQRREHRYNCRMEAQKMLHTVPVEGRVSPDSINSGPCLYDPCTKYSVVGKDATDRSTENPKPFKNGQRSEGCSRSNSFVTQYPLDKVEGSKSRLSWPTNIQREIIQNPKSSSTALTLTESDLHTKSRHHPQPCHPTVNRMHLMPLAENEIQTQYIPKHQESVTLGDAGSDCSGDTSNPDSGRGISEEGEGHPVSSNGQLGHSFDSDSPDGPAAQDVLPSCPHDNLNAFHGTSKYNHMKNNFDNPSHNKYGYPDKIPNYCHQPAYPLDASMPKQNITLRLGNTYPSAKKGVTFRDEPSHQQRNVSTDCFYKGHGTDQGCVPKSFTGGSTKSPMDDDLDVSFAHTDTTAGDDGSSTSGSYVVDQDELEDDLEDDLAAVPHLTLAESMA